MGLTPGGLLLRERWSVLAAERVSNGAGGWTETWQPTGLVLDGEGYLSESRVFERQRGDQPTNVELLELALLDHDEALTAGHRVRAADGREYELVGLLREGPVAHALARRVP